MPDWFGGLLGGFSDRRTEVERQNIREAELSNDREGRIYETLLSSPDPEIQAMAATGLLESAQPRKKKGGIRGWLGEVSANPTFGKLKSLIGTPVQTNAGETELPSPAHTDYSGSNTGQITTPSDASAPMGTAAHSLTEPNAPAGNKPQAISASVGTPPTFGPRKVFASEEDRAVAASRGKARGDTEGAVEGYVATDMSRPAALQQVQNERLRSANGATGMQSISGEIVGPDGRTTPAFGILNKTRGVYLDPNTRQPIQGFRPRTSTGSTSYGADRNAVSMELFGVSPSQLTSTQMATLNSTVQSRVQTTAYNRGVGTGRAKIETELASPIGPSAAKIYNVSPTTTLGELSNTLTLDDTQKQRLYAIGQMDVALNHIEQGILDVFPQVPEGFGGVLKTAFSLGVQKLAGDGDLAALDAAIESSLAQVAQFSGQPGSRLSDNDIKMARATLATLKPSIFNGDTINTAQARLNVIKELFDKARASVPGQPAAGTAAIGTRPPAGGNAQIVSPRTATPPPSPTNSSGPAGLFVNEQGELVQK